MTDINVGQIAEALNEKMDRNLVNADTIGQAILDKKVEVEALLEQNGYAKFTWKEGNKISKIIVQWGLTSSSSTSLDNSFPISFSNQNAYGLSFAPTSWSWSYPPCSNSSMNTASKFVFVVSGGGATTRCYFIAIGY